MKAGALIMAVVSLALGVGIGFFLGKNSAGPGETAALLGPEVSPPVLGEGAIGGGEAATALGEGSEGEEPEATGEPLAPVAEAEEAGGDNPLSGFAKMMENPVMREQIRMQMKGQVEATFAQLFRDQGFEDDEVAALSDILLERQMAITELAMKGMGSEGGLQEAMQGEFKEVKEQYDEELEALLGDEKFDEFQRFEQTQGERQQIESLKGQLANSENALSEQQEQQLMDVMWEVRESPEFSDGDASEMAEVLQGSAFPKNPDKLVEGYASMQGEVLSRSAEFLNTAQLEALEKNQQGFLDMMKMGMEMSKRMFGAGGGSDGEGGE